MNDEDFEKKYDAYLQAPEALIDGIDFETHIICTYIAKLSSKQNATYMAKYAVIEQSTGTWTRVPAETPEVRKKHVGKVLSVYEVPNYEYEVPSREPINPLIKLQSRQYVFIVAYPLINVQRPDGTFNFPLMLTTVHGNISLGGPLKLVDIRFPKAFLEQFKGPKFGIDGIRKVLKVPERPMLNNMVKPCTGHSCETAADLVYKAAVGGCDVVKDDELIADAVFNTLEDRVTAVMEGVDKANSEKGEETLYTINITDNVPDVLEHANKIQDLGGNALMVNFLVVGLSTLKAITEDPSIKIPVLAHMDFAGVWYEDPWSGVASDLTLGKFPRICGADIIVVPAPYGKAVVVDERYFMNIKAMRFPLQNINQTLPMPSGGITAGMVGKSVRDAGKDILIGSGGGIHAHPDGPIEGAKAFRQAIDAVMKGIKVKKYAKDHEALAKAMGLWGSKKTTFEQDV
ncbi:MAG: ribulose 1,5-bisphosphate carboxylase [Candidatus Lokiarchaeota archaeon]|nr:ribulose 1,5-bisphosphate carboxylase [Candidatus Lokiarchaeota archaeon]